MEIGNQSQGNVYTPFTSSLNWEVARWAKIHGPSSTSFTELMAIEGVEQQLGLSFKNARELNEIIDTHLPGRPPFQRKEILVGSECTCTLFGNPDFAPHLLFAPERHYADEEKSERMYHDMNTGSWWWKTQVRVEKDKPGATIVPVLISTDKTQLTTFRNKTAYPIYMTIGNIPKIIRRKTSSSAYLLLGYLPTTKLEQETNKAKRKRLIANLYHACMQHILKPLVSARKNGVFMSTAAGDVYQTHPIFTSFIGDYPKQVLTTCMLTGDCPRCGMTNNDLRDFGPGDVHEARSLDEALSVLNSFHLDPAHFLQAYSQIHVKPVPHPFWLDLPHSNIYQSITPDVLHQLYQGIFKHLLSRVTGQDHNQICRIFINLGIHKHFNLPKLHFMDFGTTDNFNTQSDTYYDPGRYKYTERLHIDLAKDAYAATNHKDEGMQMTTWLDRCERILRHEQYIQWRLSGASILTHIDLDLRSLNKLNPSMTKHPSQSAVSLKALQVLYGALLFKVALRRFISSMKDQTQSCQQLECTLWQHHLPFTRLPIWHIVKFTCIDPVTGACSTSDSIHVQPAKYDKSNRFIPGCFDTALINEGNGTAHVINGYNIGHVRIVFSIPTRYHNQVFSHGVTVPQHLAYVQWYTKLSEPNPNHGMHQQNKSRIAALADGKMVAWHSTRL
ncbi:hypothetical protein EI94DRAFT_1773877 [Lactarius quietus]|nr:hypothetical protein EI94DRAFT_1773877 [Lactarius quietus]